MQVDRQPSPWPCVAMLVGLLLFCLTVPRYWRNDNPIAPERAIKSNAPSPNEAVGLRFGMGGAHAGFGVLSAGPSPDNDLLHLFAPPTIEELIAARAGAGQFD